MFDSFGMCVLEGTGVLMWHSMMCSMVVFISSLAFRLWVSFLFFTLADFHIIYSLLFEYIFVEQTYHVKWICVMCCKRTQKYSQRLRFSFAFFLLHCVCVCVFSLFLSQLLYVRAFFAIMHKFKLILRWLLVLYTESNLFFKQTFVSYFANGKNRNRETENI